MMLLLVLFKRCPMLRHTRPGRETKFPPPPPTHACLTAYPRSYPLSTLPQTQKRINTSASLSFPIVPVPGLDASYYSTSLRRVNSTFPELRKSVCSWYGSLPKAVGCQRSGVK